MKVGATLILALLLAAFVPGVSFAGPPDSDGDGIEDGSDTCPLTFNPGASQTTDSETVGTPDGVPDACDNCVAIPNANQCDSNSDGFGNVCDQDLGGAGATGIVSNPDLNNGSFGFAANFGATGAPCTVDQDFDDSSLANDNVNNVDLNNPVRGFAANFGSRMDGGVGGSCPGGATCRSGRTCAVLPPVAGGCDPEVGFFAP